MHARGVGGIEILKGEHVARRIGSQNIPPVRQSCRQLQRVALSRNPFHADTEHVSQQQRRDVQGECLRRSRSHLDRDGTHGVAAARVGELNGEIEEADSCRHWPTG